MTQHFLHLNPDKTEVLLIGPEVLVSAATQFIGLNIKSTAKNLGIIFDQYMTLISLSSPVFFS